MTKKDKSRLLIVLVCLALFSSFFVWDLLLGNDVSRARIHTYFFGTCAYLSAFFIWWKTRINALSVFVFAVILGFFTVNYYPQVAAQVVFSVSLPLVTILLSLSVFRAIFRRKLGYSRNLFERF